MRIFALADASKRKAKPIGVLLWEPSEADEQGLFSLELSSTCDESLLPLSLSFCARRKGRRATHEESRLWVKSRIAPESRHNIAEILMANGLSRYDEVGLFAASMGRSSDDDLLAYEINVPDSIIAELRAADSKRQSGKSGGWSQPTRADRVLDAVTRKHGASEVRYALVDIGERPKAPFSEQRDLRPMSAQRIGASIRSRRLEIGLTQKQLAARAGITQTVLSRVESGKGNPTLGLLEDIAIALGTELDVSLRLMRQGV